MDIRVAPKIQDATHDVMLTSDGERWAFRLQGGPAGVQESSISPSTLVFNKTGAKFGDFEPGMSHIEMRDWAGGRGQEFFVDDPSKFFDSKTMMTAIPGYLMPGFNWFTAFKQGWWSMNAAAHYWKPLYGNLRYIGQPITTTAGVVLDHAFIWLKKVGVPGNLTIEIRADNAGAPTGTLKKTCTAIAASDFTDVLAEFKRIVLPTTYTSEVLTIHIKLIADAGDNRNNHWEVGVDDGTASAVISSNDSGYVAGGFKLYYVLTTADANNKKFWRVIANSGTMYALYSIANVVYIAPFKTDGTLDASVYNVTLAGTPTDVLCIHNTVYVAQGTAGNVKRIYYNSGWTSADETAQATCLAYFYDATAKKGYVYRSANHQVSKAENKSDFSAMGSWSTLQDVGDGGSNIIAMTSYDNKVTVRKQESVWSGQYDQFQKEKVDLDSSRDTVSPLLTKDIYLYFGWNFSLERFYSGSVDDIGPWKGTGLPMGRTGTVTALVGYMGWIFAAVNAGAGTSSVLLWDGRGWHEMFRMYEAGQQINNIFVATANARNYLYVSTQNELIAIWLPKNCLNPLQDTSMRYAHEGVLTSSTIDMGSADMAKFFKELSLQSKNLNSLNKISVDYQVDDEIGTTTWTVLDTAIQSPKDVLIINRGRKRAVRFRLRFITYALTLPPVMVAAVLKAFGRTPTKRQWVMKIRVDTLGRSYKNEQERDPNELYNWLWKACQEAAGIRMNSIFEVMDDVWVVVEPPNIVRSTINKILGWWTGTFQIVLREI